MSARALVLTYHAIEAGPPPLFVEPALFREHLDAIAEAPVRAVSLDRLGEELAAGGPREPSVAVTFDDGFASVVEQAAPMLIERGIPATIFCVTGHLGGLNDWATEPASSPRRPLASAAALADVVAGGLIRPGSHGMTHLPLALADPAAAEREIVGSRSALEDALGAPVDWFALPASAPPGAGARALIERTYAGAAGGGNRPAGAGSDRWAVPRADAHYLRRPSLLRRALEGDDLYLALRRAAARARRLVARDYVSPAG